MNNSSIRRRACLVKKRGVEGSERSGWAVDVWEDGSVNGVMGGGRWLSGWREEEGEEDEKDEGEGEREGDGEGEGEEREEGEKRNGWMREMKEENEEWEMEKDAETGEWESGRRLSGVEKKGEREDAWLRCCEGEVGEGEKGTGREDEGAEVVVVVAEGRCLDVVGGGENCESK